MVSGAQVRRCRGRFVLLGPVDDVVGFGPAGVLCSRVDASAVAGFLVLCVGGWEGSCFASDVEGSPSGLSTMRWMSQSQVSCWAVWLEMRWSPGPLLTLEVGAAGAEQLIGLVRGVR